MSCGLEVEEDAEGRGCPTRVARRQLGRPNTGCDCTADSGPPRPSSLPSGARTRAAGCSGWAPESSPRPRPMRLSRAAGWQKRPPGLGFTSRRAAATSHHRSRGRLQLSLGRVARRHQSACRAGAPASGGDAQNVWRRQSHAAGCRLQQVLASAAHCHQRGVDATHVLVALLTAPSPSVPTSLQLLPATVAR